MERDLHILSRFSDTASFLYVEHAAIERHDSAIEIRRENESVDVPAASVSTLFLGPGTRITHAAVVALAECGTAIIWAGQELQRFYAHGAGKTRSSANLLRQASAWADPARRLSVIKRLYSLRFADDLPAGLSLAQIRGREGVRVREAYAKASRDYGVPWAGRRYTRGEWGAADPINRALSAGATILYGVCHSAITASGFSPGIGFIHTGKSLSFVYDVADLYKADLLIPVAFEATSREPLRPEAIVRRMLRARCHEVGLMERAVSDLASLFGGPDEPPSTDAEVRDRDDSPGELWDPGALVPGGVNHGRDDA